MQGEDEDEKSASPDEETVRRETNPYLPGANIKPVRENGLMELLDQTENGTACPICLKHVFPHANAIAKFACCQRFYHQLCFSKSSWNSLLQEMRKSDANPRCPVCTRPERSRRVAQKIQQEVWEAVKGMSYDEDEDDFPEPMSSSEKKAKELRNDMLGLSSGEDEQNQEEETTNDDDSAGDTRWARVKMTMAGAGLAGTKDALQELRTSGRKMDFNWIKHKGLKIDDLLNDFTLKDLHENRGVKTWKQLRTIGFRLDHLTTIDHMRQIPQLVYYYKVNAEILRRDLGLTVSGLAKLSLSGSAMAQLGCDAHELCMMGLTKDDIKRFSGCPMGEWINPMGLSVIHLHLLKFKAKDFYNDPLFLGHSWSIDGLARCLDLNYSTLKRLGLAVKASNETSGRRSRQPQRKPSAFMQPNGRRPRNYASGPPRSSQRYNRYPPDDYRRRGRY